MSDFTQTGAQIVLNHLFGKSEFSPFAIAAGYTSASGVDSGGSKASSLGNFTLSAPTGGPIEAVNDADISFGAGATGATLAAFGTAGGGNINAYIADNLPSQIASVPANNTFPAGDFKFSFDVTAQVGLGFGTPFVPTSAGMYLTHPGAQNLIRVLLKGNGQSAPVLPTSLEVKFWTLSGTSPTEVNTGGVSAIAVTPGDLTLVTQSNEVYAENDAIVTVATLTGAVDIDAVSIGATGEDHNFVYRLPSRVSGVAGQTLTIPAQGMKFGLQTRGF